MTASRPLALVLTFASLFGASCSDDPSPIDAGVIDGGASDAAGEDASAVDGAVSDAGSPDGGASIFGFSLRVPGSREITCSGFSCPGGKITAQDVDYVCDLHYGTFQGYVYVQSHGESFLDFMGFIYAIDGAWYSDGTNATPTTANYLWGGNHHNDNLIVDVPGYQVRWDHSSYGFGFRQCQPMDCAVVYEAGPGMELASGCGRDRSVPAICKLVGADGTVGEWRDTFMRCPGDT